MMILKLRMYIMMLCISDYIFTIIGIQGKYVSELNPLFINFFNIHQYSIGLLFKISLTYICLMILYEKQLWYILCMYLGINSMHIIYLLFNLYLSI